MIYRRGDEVKIVRGPQTATERTIWISLMDPLIGQVGTIMTTTWFNRDDIAQVKTANGDSWWYPIDCLASSNAIDGHLSDNRHVSQELPL